MPLQGKLLLAQLARNQSELLGIAVSTPRTALRLPSRHDTHCSPAQVKALLAQLARTHAELELLFGRFLRAHPLLAPLGEKGTLKHLVWAVLAAPILGPLLAALALALSVRFVSSLRKEDGGCPLRTATLSMALLV